MTIKVIGAGYGRTGTLSLKAALEQLGLGPCYHMLEVINRPENADAWYDAAQDDGAAADWDDMLQGYQSCVDWPAAHFWRPLSAHYPDAKVILTRRDEEAWWQSMTKTILANMLKTNDEVTNPDRVRMRRMSRDLIVTKVFEGILEDREHVLAAYRRNIREVTMGIPKDRLLIFDVAQGWAPLCEFLGVATPDTPFPRTNNTQEFQERLTNRLATEANANKQA